MIGYRCRRRCVCHPGVVTRFDLQAKKRAWRRRVDTGRLRPVVRVGLDAVIAVEILGARVADLRRRRPAPIDTSDVTAVIKTFERPRQSRRLVRSIRRLHPDVRILLLDDSVVPREVPGAELVSLPHNSGISVGRNTALAMVDTPYAVMLDDDFVFERRTRFDRPLAWMDEHPDVDILGGLVVNLPDWSRADYSRAPLFPGAAPPKVPIGSEIGGLRVFAKVPNFLLVRTERVREVGWSEELKVLEHRDFFTRASGTLVTAHDPAWRVLHARNPFDRGTPVRMQNQREAEAFLWQRYVADRGGS